MALALPVISTILEAGLRLIDKVIPDPQAKAQAQLELMRMQQAGEFKALEADVQVALAQAAINKEEAASPDLFRGGWRPAVGWVCASGLGYQFLVRPLAEWASAGLGWGIPPALNLGDLLPLMFGMLGLGGFRTYEKVKGLR